MKKITRSYLITVINVGLVLILTYHLTGGAEMMEALLILSVITIVNSIVILMIHTLWP
jgi:hypothetical protein